jgi:hypothetical protein
MVHLLAPLGHGCPRFDVDARDRLMTVSATGTGGGIAFPPTSRSYYYDNAGRLLPAKLTCMMYR